MASPKTVLIFCAADLKTSVSINLDAKYPNSGVALESAIATIFCLLKLISSLIALPY